MSGLLHRLAARALGIANTVRPVAGAVTFPAQAEAPAPLASGDVDPAEPRIAVGHPTVASHDVPPALDRDSVAEPAAPDVDRSPPVSTASPPSGQPARAVATTESDAQSGPALEMHAVLPPAPLPTIENANEPEGLRVAPEQREARRGPGPRWPDVPRLLALRPRREALPVAAVPVPHSPGAARAPVVEEATEVHVSIGRIEVTAVHEAPPSKRAPARPRKPRSLDEYLAGREERRS